MNYYKEWIIEYHGDLYQALQGTNIMVDIISDRYALIKTRGKEIPYLKNLRQIEKSKPILEIAQQTELTEIVSIKKQNISETEVTVGWISHKANINYNNYWNRGGSRILCIHDGIREHSKEQIVSVINKYPKDYKTDKQSPMDMCIGNTGVIPDSKVVLVNWQRNRFYTADAIRAICFIISKLSNLETRQIIYFPFDISEKTNNNFIQEIISDMLLDYKIEIVASLDDLFKILLPATMMDGFRNINIAYELAPEDAIIDAFVTYNSFGIEKSIPLPPNTVLYPLDFPYSGLRGPMGEIKKLLTEFFGQTVISALPFILGNEPFNITQTEFEATFILTQPTNLKGRNTLIGIIDTGIDYTNPVFIDVNGKTKIVSIWDQTIGVDSPDGYGTEYTKEMINMALENSDPLQVVPHEDEWGHGTILAGIAAGVAPEAEIVIVKLKPASPTMQDIYFGKYNPLGFSALDIANAIQFMANISNQLGKPISICLPSGTNSGSHDGTNILDAIITSYSTNPGVCVVLPVGEEANKQHHATGDLTENKEQDVILTIPKGQSGFLMEIWAMFGDKIEVLLIPPKIEGENIPIILLNEAQTQSLPGNSFVWSQGSKLDVDTGCQVIRFRLGEPLIGNWIIRIKGIELANGKYHIWIPKTGMILPGTVLSPSSPFTTIYNTSTGTGVIAVGCYDGKSSSACSSSGRGFTRDNRVSPDFVVEGTNIPGPLPANKWGVITGTSPASAITIGVTSLIYENQTIQKEELANTLVMKGILVGQVKRELTLSYPNPSSGYGVLDINPSGPNKRWKYGI